MYYIITNVYCFTVMLQWAPKVYPLLFKSMRLYGQISKDPDMLESSVFVCLIDLGHESLSELVKLKNI